MALNDNRTHFITLKSYRNKSNGPECWLVNAGLGIGVLVVVYHVRHGGKHCQICSMEQWGSRSINPDVVSPCKHFCTGQRRYAEQEPHHAVEPHQAVEENPVKNQTIKSAISFVAN